MKNPQLGGQLSARVADLHASPIREILSVIDRPGMVSFAGGLPAAETFPTFSLAAFPPALMQYGSSEGEPELREQVAKDLNEIGLECSKDQILILSGSQQGIDLVAKLFIDQGTSVAVESPTYLAALQVFRFFGARFRTFDPQEPHQAWSADQRPSFAYTIPTFQNPTGRCYSADERDALARSCDVQGVPLFEDDPYRDLAYDECDRTPICARITRAPWIYQGSFSKSLAPGLRLGFLAASVDLITYLTRLKQAADLHSSRMSQWLVLEQLRDPNRKDRLARLVATYRCKRDFFAQALERHLGKLATWQVPPGGLFFWLTLTRPIDTRTLLTEAIQRGVAFMPGEAFYPELPTPCGSLRLNFSHADEEQTERGLAILATLLS
ncbi:MAG: PLP-dependent aminotransferase family protein [Steroidobacteraceae bacterium]|jgi:DNA-binding transcriptional MocR family regulator